MPEEPLDNAISFPEDVGTGLDNTDDADWTSAGHFAGQAAHSNTTQYVEEGFDLDVRRSNGDPVLDVGAGTAHLRYEGNIAVQDNGGNYTNNWDGPVSFAVSTESLTESIPLEDNTTLDLYLVNDLTENNRVTVETRADSSEPSGPTLKIGEIDTTEDVATPINREPNGEYKSLSVGKTTTEQYPSIHPEAFGAEGDGQTDDTQAFTDLVKSLGDGDRRTLELQGGKRYVISDWVSLPVENIRGIRGNGAEFFITDPNAGVECVGNTPDTVTGKPTDSDPALHKEEYFPLIHGVSFIGDEGTETWIGDGLKLERTFGAVVSNCKFFHLDRGVIFSGTGNNRNTIINDCQIWDCSSYGVHFETGGSIHQILINGCMINWIGGVHIFDEDHDLANLNIQNCNLESGASTHNESPTHLLHSICHNRNNHKVHFCNNEVEHHREMTDYAIKVEGSEKMGSWIITNNYLETQSGLIRLDAEVDVTRWIISNNQMQGGNDRTVHLTAPILRGWTISHNHYAHDEIRIDHPEGGGGWLRESTIDHNNFDRGDLVIDGQGLTRSTVDSNRFTSADLMIQTDDPLEMNDSSVSNNTVSEGDLIIEDHSLRQSAVDHNRITHGILRIHGGASHWQSCTIRSNKIHGNYDVDDMPILDIGTGTTVYQFDCSNNLIYADDLDGDGTGEYVITVDFGAGNTWGIQVNDNSIRGFGGASEGIQVINADWRIGFIKNNLVQGFNGTDFNVPDESEFDSAVIKDNISI